MTFRQLVEQELTPDSNTIQKNIDYLNNLAKTMPKDIDKKTLESISLGLRNQLAQKKVDEQNNKTPTQPVGNKPTIAQSSKNGNTAQTDTTLSTAQ